MSDMAHRKGLSVALGLFVICSGSAAAAASLCARNVTSETQYYNCGSSWTSFFKSHYDIDEVNWNEGFGWGWECDTSLPLGRTFNGIEMLHYAAPVDATTTGDFTGNILHWGGNYAINNIDELDALCGNGEELALTYVGLDDWTRLYAGFFYDQSAPLRAATLLHEARHAAGCFHNGNTGVQRCWAEKSCDEAWGNGCDDRTDHGANGYQVLWLSWYAYEGDAYHTSSTLRQLAVAKANIILQDRFDVPVCFRIAQNGVPIQFHVDPATDRFRRQRSSGQHANKEIKKLA